MENEKIKIGIPIVVEGKYDKIKVSSAVDGCIITTDGFGVFKSAEKKAFLKKIAENGIIILTDSDGAGKVIRSKISGYVPREKVFNLYVPEIKGKEKRKSAPSKEGLLGVEGMNVKIIRDVFSDFIRQNGELGNMKSHSPEDEVTMTDFFEVGMTGAQESRILRDEFAQSRGFPRGMTAKALLSAVKILMDRNEFFALANSLKKDRKN